MTQLAPDLADFDAFFAERKAARGPGAGFVFGGRTYTLPTETPLAYTLLLEANEERSDVAALREILTPLFGPDALEQWIAAGMGDEEFQIVLAWSMANLRSPGSMSMQQAAERVAEAEAGKARTPRNRAERRAKKPRATSGTRS